MAIRNILNIEDETLSKRSREVKNFDERLHILLDDLAETMRASSGVGLAAPQVGVLRRAAVIEISDGALTEIVNPEIISSEGSQSSCEGCLSLPGVYGMVERPMSVEVKAYDRYGKEFHITGDGFMARALCHEIDHLDGKLFTRLVTEYIDSENREKESETDCGETI